MRLHIRVKAKVFTYPPDTRDFRIRLHSNLSTLRLAFRGLSEKRIIVDTHGDDAVLQLHESQLQQQNASGFCIVPSLLTFQKKSRIIALFLRSMFTSCRKGRLVATTGGTCMRVKLHMYIVL